MFGGLLAENVLARAPINSAEVRFLIYVGSSLTCIKVLMMSSNMLIKQSRLVPSIPLIKMPGRSSSSGVLSLFLLEIVTAHQRLDV